jgi:hypothetical protein
MLLVSSGLWASVSQESQSGRHLEFVPKKHICMAVDAVNRAEIIIVRVSVATIQRSWHLATLVRRETNRNEQSRLDGRRDLKWAQSDRITAWHAEMTFSILCADEHFDGPLESVTVSTSKEMVNAAQAIPNI